MDATGHPEIYPLSLHDALPIYAGRTAFRNGVEYVRKLADYLFPIRSEEHTSELQSLTNLVCRLLLEKKNRQLSGLHESDDAKTSPNAGSAGIVSAAT